MPARRKPTPKKSSALIPVLAGLLALGLILAIAGFGFAAAQESHDSFCASCHTQPESTYYERSTAAAGVDLASFHTGQKTRCIDCHAGSGLSGRLAAELMGAQNALRWYTKNAVQPAPLTHPIGDGNCLKCHQAVTQEGYQLKAPALPGSQMEEGRAGHWHQFLARWQGLDKSAATCVSCHAGHATGSTADNGFMDIQSVQSVCEACHRVAGEG
ncbi:NapC/NirT cytochrome c family, N-terminal region [Longilinea arvoryzae]|uniref:NapC/NirT cytochrome c family, N-terminal region n=1 Tax=Longilinea arvoryzae TaxID=360412 RepID=A0A0K8MXZ6_9CHLR|nr:NapC/NirT family cytochrome c [Longilinea arvoryzae]GAP16129.1 NapC/NirT cytochrome c family, N-terminal region [Longilinea arvoryzae]